MALPGGVVPRQGNGVRVGLPQRSQAVGTRVVAAAQALGAPKAGPKAQHKAPPMPRSQKQPLPRAQPKVAKTFIEMNPAQQQHLATKQVQQETQAELKPFREQAQQIAGTQQTVANRFQGYGEATDKLLGGIQGEQAASAKTFENQAADAAVKAQGEVNTTGQNAVTNNAGYEDPQLRSQLAAESGNVAGIGAAQQATAATLGQNEGNYLANIR